MQPLKVVSEYEPNGDQPQAIEKLARGIEQGLDAQTLLGVTGSGKSVTADTDVLVRVNGRERLTPIGPLVDGLLARYAAGVRREADTEVLEADDQRDHVEAMSFDPHTGAVSWRTVRQFVRHDSPRDLWRLKTSCGRSVTVTGDHSVYVMRDGAVTLLPTSEVRAGDWLPLPRALEGPASPLAVIPAIDADTDEARTYVELPMDALDPAQLVALRSVVGAEKHWRMVHEAERMSLKAFRSVATLAPGLEDIARFGTKLKSHDFPSELPMDPSLARFLGYFIGEGHATDSYAIISSADAEVVEDITRTADRLGVGWHHRPGTYDYQVNSAFLTRLLARWCGSGAHRKHLPTFWPQLADEHLSPLLSAYFSADGGVDGAAVTCLTASRQLASDVSYALLRFGIVARIQERRLVDPEGGPIRIFYRVSVSGQAELQAFQDRIGFTIERKRTRLRALLGKDGNTNVDLAPIDGGTLKAARNILGWHQRELAARTGCSRAMISMLEHGRRLPSASLTRRFMEIFREEARRQGIPELAALAASWEPHVSLFWTPIMEVAVEAGQRHVYDFSVAENETFLAGHGGIFVHNTFTIAKVIERVQRPTLVLAHNKTLAAQLCNELREFFPDNAVEYFISYYDYYQPEAYVARTDTYIEKSASINDEIDRLRHSATRSLLERRDVIVVASVSCIYGLGLPETYLEGRLELIVGEEVRRDDLLRHLVTSHYERNDVELMRGRFRVRGDVLEIVPSFEDNVYRIELFGDEIDRISEIDPVTGEILGQLQKFFVYPAKHFVTPENELERAIAEIESELDAQMAYFKAEGKLLEAQRIEMRTRYDLEMLKEVGYCNGVENYSRVLAGRPAGSAPSTLLDYFPDDFLVVIDESHVTLPQLGGMYRGDKVRKETLIEHGFRLPSAADNRPLKIEEFWERITQKIFVSATPGDFEINGSQQVVEQIIRPTGLVDPEIDVRPITGQVDDLLGEIRDRVARQHRVLITTLTKKMAEDLTEYFQEIGIRVRYLHSDIQSMERVEILRDLRIGNFDVLVGVNLLREGLDLPEVSLMAIMDADKEGFLRAERSLIQMIGRAARHSEGRVIMYADKMTDSMTRALDETERRRNKQLEYNRVHGITPRAIVKSSRNRLLESLKAADSEGKYSAVPAALGPKESEKLIKELEQEMKAAASVLDFELAAKLRDRIKDLREAMQAAAKGR